jgi:mono/diheme cytochrome c family protein
MKAFTPLGVAVALAFSTGTTTTAQEPGAAGDVQAGRAVALKICRVCHMVSAGPQREPVMKPPAPSFESIANRPGATSDSLLAFLETKHRSVGNYKEMPGLKITDEQSRDVVHYIMSLRKPPR